jgi:ABC-2 type transport system ATP-binding protein
MNPIEIDQINKSYGDVQAVKNVSFSVAEDSIFGLIGPDGAGKTTIIRMIVSLLKADSGTILFNGKKVEENISLVRTSIGYMPQRFSLYQDLTVEENLKFFGDLFKIERSLQKERMHKLYEFSRLEPFKNRRSGNLSGGMKQKLALSCMLMHEPKVIVLDEPTFGVDPVSRTEFWEILKELVKGNTTILVTTAYMDEADLCDEVGLIFDGKLLAVAAPHKLTDMFKNPLYFLESNEPHKIIDKIASTALSDATHIFGGGVHITDNENYGESEVKKILRTTGVEAGELQRIQPTLEDLFLKLMSGEVE